MILVDRANLCQHLIIMSEIGPNHLSTGKGNEDSYAYSMNDDSFVLAVSDGVGSCKYAKLGSKAICDICVEMFNQCLTKGTPLPEDLCRQLLESWKAWLPVPNFDYCATLKALFCLNDMVTLVSIGDGILAIATTTESVSAPIQAHSFANETNCLNPDTKAGDLWSQSFNISGTTFSAIMATDGISSNIIEGQEINLVQSIQNDVDKDKLLGEIDELFSEISELNGDDKTLGVVKYDSKCS